MPLNFDLAGKWYDAVEHVVTAEEIAEYAAASGDPNPRHLPGPDQVASLVFPAVPGFSELGRVVGDPDLGVGNPLMIVHGEQDFRYYRPIRAGDKLTMTPLLEKVEDKGSGATFVVRIATANATGEPVVDTFSTIFVRGGGSGADRPTSAAEPEPHRGRELARFTSFVPTDMPARYAAASGDFNPVHTDESVAKAVGLPGVINHGLGTLSLVAGGLVTAVAGGDVTRVRRLQVRFTDMVFPGVELETSLWESAGGGHFETMRPDGGAVLSGRIEEG